LRSTYLHKQYHENNTPKNQSISSADVFFGSIIQNRIVDKIATLPCPLEKTRFRPQKYPARSEKIKAQHLVASALHARKILGTSYIIIYVLTTKIYICKKVHAARLSGKYAIMVSVERRETEARLIQNPSD
jgi:hypothetical protein